MTWDGPSGGIVSIRGRKQAGNRTQPSEDCGGKGGVREPAGKTRGQEPQQGAAAPPGLTGLWMEADVSPVGRKQDANALILAPRPTG